MSEPARSEPPAAGPAPELLYQRYPTSYRPPSPSRFDVRGNRGLGIALLVITGGVVLGKIVQAATSFAAANALQTRALTGALRGGSLTDGALDPSLVIYVLSFGFGLLYVPAWFVAGLWLVRIHRNAVSVNPRLVRYSVLWAWFAWVLPIASWLMPKRFLDEVWVATAAGLPEGDRDAEVVWTGPWWTLWLLFQFLGSVSAAMGGALVRPDRIVLPALDVVVAIVGLLAYAAWLRVVLSACDTQAALERSLRRHEPVARGA